MSEILRFVCGHCGKQLSAKPQHAGRSTRCPGCQKPVAVPLPAPVPSHSEELNDNDIFRLLGGSNSNQEADAGTETETANVTEPVQSDATSATSNEMQTEKSLAITGRFQRLAQLPRVIVVAGGILLVALVGLVGWSLTKSARTTQVAVDKQDDDLEAVDQRAAPVAVDKQNDNPPAAVVEKPRAESIDLLKGDFDEVTTNYFKQKFPDSTNVEATLKLCLNVEALVRDADSATEEMKKYPKGSGESNAQGLRLVSVMTYLTKNLARDDPFLLREAFKLSACRVVVAQSRFEESKRASNLAKTAEELKVRTDTTKRDEAKITNIRASNRAIGNRMAAENLDTVEIERTAGLK